MDKRYQVFVSSTYADLKQERQQVIQALMEMDCIPSGMELFPAADEEQFEFIKKVIDDCDYYLLIIGGRYGSVGTDGLSYTEMEYQYALRRGIKVVALLHENPDQITVEKSEISEEMRERLRKFREQVKKGRLVKFWKSADALPGLVALSLSKTIKMYPAVGWVRADKVPTEDVSGELLRQKYKIEELETALSSVRANRLEGASSLSQGSETFSLNYAYVIYRQDERLHGDTCVAKLSWNEIFFAISPYLMSPCSEDRMKSAVNDLLLETQVHVLGEKYNINDLSFCSFSVSDTSFQTIKIQFRALGLIEKAANQNSDYWQLTLYGDNLMIELRAIESSS